jgi:superfamily II DNA or RNA helicase
MARTKPPSNQAFLPPQFEIDATVNAVRIVQLRRPAATISGFDVRHISRDGVQGRLLVQTNGDRTLLVSGDRKPSEEIAPDVLATPKGEPLRDQEHYLRSRARVRWLEPASAPHDGFSLDHWRDICRDVLASWQDRFSFREEHTAPTGEVVPGLRPPQIGALHAALAHWKVSDDPATIVMPTGTGKTETMLGLLAHQRMERLLVAVPTIPLRRQTIEKFVSLGLLNAFGVLGPGAAYPVVGDLDRVLTSINEVDELFLRCNVLVATMPALIRCPDATKARMAEHSSHLFIDEAHHVPADRWAQFRDFFKMRRVVQFTATPFRRDGKRVDGKVVFHYPLRLAQQQGYFRPIKLLAVHEYDPERHDEAIATAAVQQLRTDMAAGLQHLLMARTDSIDRAGAVHQLYRRLAPDLQPLLVHSHKSRKATTEALAAVRNRSSKVVVCVDMLGEGFDLPELKIAALHDVHKSLAVTLQFTGRFTRGKAKIGDATMVANVADPEVEDRLEALYAEDADWNVLLRRLSEGASARELRRSEILDGFVDPPTRIRLENVLPKMSTMVYRTKCQRWRPKAVVDVLGGLLEKPSINHKEQLAAFFTMEQEPVPWGDIRHLLKTTFHLYLAHWDSARGLLFIHTSNKDVSLDGVAKAIAAEDAELIRGEDVFRTLHGVNQLVLINLGLNHSLSHAVRFTMYIGADIREGLSQANLQTKRKSNIFGRGYEAGEKASIGCSAKGRIWSHQIAYDLSEWMAWCHGIGTKLLDERISIQRILEHVIVPTVITQRPPLVPLTIEWSEHFYTMDEQVVVLDVRGDLVPLVDVGLELTGHADTGPLRFRVFTPQKAVEYEIVFGERSVQYRPVDGSEATLRLRRRSLPLSAWLDGEPPIVRFESGAFLIYNNLFELHREGLLPFAADRIVPLDWSGVDLTKESQGPARAPDSIQRRVIDHLSGPGHGLQYDVIFDDDNTNEAADIVALKVSNEELLIHLFHCKFAKDGRVSARVEDLYAVCGQAQRSVQWKARHAELMKHLQRREASQVKRLGVSRFQRGDARLLNTIARKARHLRPQMRVAVVQPGLSKAAALDRHLQLLAATEVYLTETFGVGLDVYASP